MALEIQQLMLSRETKAARKVCIYLRTRNLCPNLHFSRSYQLSDSLLQDLFENATDFFTHRLSQEVQTGVQRRFYALRERH